MEQEQNVKGWTYDRVKDLIQSIKNRIPAVKLPPLPQPRLSLPKLSIRSRTADLPIIQGGMGVGISLSGLASSVADNGGVGVIAANGIGLIEPDYFKDGRAANIRALRREIRTAKQKSSGLIGVNIMVALQDFHELLEASIEERADMLFLGAGLPIKNLPLEKIRAADIQVIPIVSSARAAKLIFSMWKKIYNDVPDAVVVEGPKAGGHLGVSENQIDDDASAIEIVIPEVTALLKPFEAEYDRSIPVIAAGGVFTGEDIYRLMKLGAQGVQMGTRFAATDECDADIRFKEAIVSCRKEEIGIIKSPVGLPGRAILNDFLTQRDNKKRKFSCPWQCLAGCRADEANYCISLALNNARKGILDRGFVFIGTNGYRVQAIQPVAELLKELKEQFAAALAADKQRSVSAAADMLSALKAEYKAAEKRMRELRIRYGDLLSQYSRAFEAFEQSVVSSTRDEIKKTSAKLTEIQLSITEKVSELQHDLPFVRS